MRPEQKENATRGGRRFRQVLVSAVLSAAAAGLVAGPARAQPGPPPPALPPPYQPPDGFAYYSAPPPPEPPPAPGVHRLISVTFGVGPGMLIGPGETDVALSYSVVRLGIGIIRNLQFVASYEGAGTSSTSPATDESSWLSQNQWVFGLQFFFLQRLYARAGMGVGTVHESTDNAEFNGGTGLNFSGGAGVEFLQTQHVALGAEMNASTTRYSDESWETIAWNLTLTLY